MIQNTLTDFAYDEAGHLIGEYSVVGNLTSGLDNLLNQPSGNAITTLEETVWLGNIPLATIQNGMPYYIYTDQLGTPRQIDDGNGTAVWAWDTQTFGDNAPTANPGNSLLGIAFSYNPRFPGQYADAESGLFHNNARDYNPATGRYVESDPIGLMSGVNTYAYVGGNPVDNADPSGLLTFVFQYMLATVNDQPPPMPLHEAINLDQTLDPIEVVGTAAASLPLVLASAGSGAATVGAGGIAAGRAVCVAVGENASTLGRSALLAQSIATATPADLAYQPISDVVDTLQLIRDISEEASLERAGESLNPTTIPTPK